MEASTTYFPPDAIRTASGRLPDAIRTPSASDSTLKTHQILQWLHLMAAAGNHNHNSLNDLEASTTTTTTATTTTTTR